jgi:hypothetical protein
MEGSLWWILIGVPLVLAVCLAAVFLAFSDPRAVRERRRRMMRLAERLGLRYFGSFGEGRFRFLPACALFERGEERAVSNVMGEPRTPPRLVLFDYGFMFAQGGRRGAAREVGMNALYLVAMAGLPDGAAPTSAAVYQTDWFGGPIGVVGLYRVEPEGDEEFARDFFVSGEPRRAVEAMLNGPVREVLKSWQGRGPRPAVEILPRWIVVYVESDPRDRRVADRAAALLKHATAVAAALGATPAEEREAP